MRNILDSIKRIPIRHNVSINILDQNGNIVSSHTGHNAATNSLLSGVAHFLTGDGVLNQGYHMLSAYVPKYISLGTMGLINQEEDEDGLPTGIGSVSYLGLTYNDLNFDQLKMLGKESGSTEQITVEDDEILRYSDYIQQVPGYGADGYDPGSNNNRPYMGLGPTYENRPYSDKTVDCELISDSFPRVSISYREIVPETEAELPQTIDVVFSAMISTGALAQFREPGKDYVFITEAGLWSEKTWLDGGDNGLLAGYRIVPPNEENWGLIPSDITSPEQAKENRQILRQNILRVGINQVVQVIWKIQLGGMDQLGGLTDLFPQYQLGLQWIKWY